MNPFGPDEDEEDLKPSIPPLAVEAVASPSPSPLPKGRKRKLNLSASNSTATTVSACGPCSRRRQKCDDNRPCSRCIVKGCEDECINSDDAPPPKVKEEVPPPPSTLSPAKASKQKDSDYVLPGKLRGRRKNLMSDLEVAMIPVDQSASRELLLESIGESSSPLTWSRTFSDFFRIAKWNLIRLGALYLQQNHLTSLWVEPLPKEVFRVAMEFPNRYSGAFFADFLIHQPLSWKWFLHSLEFLLDSPTTKLLQERIIQRAIDDATVDDLSRQMLVTMKEFPGFNKPTLVFMRNNHLKLSEEEKNIINSLFNVNSIEDSDVAMYQIREFFDTDTMSFKVLVELNEQMEALGGLPLKTFAEFVHAGRGLFKVGPLFWNYDKPFWPQLTEFCLGSVFHKPVFLTTVVDVMTCFGTKVPSLIHAFASYDTEFGIRTAITICLKPFSQTFKPDSNSTHEHVDSSIVP
jgi:hypothetical protein